MSGETSSRAAKELLHQCQPFVIDEEEAENEDLWGQPRVRPLLPVGTSPPYEQALPRPDHDTSGHEEAS